MRLGTKLSIPEVYKLPIKWGRIRTLLTGTIEYKIIMVQCQSIVVFMIMTC